MAYWALVFLLVAIIAGALGFGGVAVAISAKIIFFILLVLLVVALVAHVRA
jgi:uncharacterized membrane protein YtjA (UPF0391 family)